MRETVIQVRVSLEEKAEIEKRAGEEHMPVGRWVRDRLLNEERVKGKVVKRGKGAEVESDPFEAPVPTSGEKCPYPCMKRHVHVR